MPPKSLVPYVVSETLAREEQKLPVMQVHSEDAPRVVDDVRFDTKLLNSESEQPQSEF